MLKCPMAKKKTKIKPASVEAGDQLQLLYVKVSELKKWERNPKKHDLPAIKKSFEQHGFKDPPKWEAVLDGLVEGNGRFEALMEMEAAGEDPPRGILREKETGAWCAPVLIGVDAKTRKGAEAYAIDHNNLVLTGTGFTDLEIAGLWEDDYVSLLKELSEGGQEFASLSEAGLHEIEVILGPDNEFFDPEDLPDIDIPKEIGEQEKSYLLFIGFREWDDMMRAVKALSLGERVINEKHKTISLNVYTGDDEKAKMKYIDDWEKMLDG